jgi:orotidine-5'-phosphate decarboxylase
MKGPIFVALDTPDLERAKAIAGRVRNHVGGLKLGLEFFAANGRHGVNEMAEFGLPIFLDLKLHDIPNTVAKAVQALRPLNPANHPPSMHAGGRALLEMQRRPLRTGTMVFASPSSTSLAESDLGSIGRAPDATRAGRTADDLAREAGLDGVVCSGMKLRRRRKFGTDGFFVVPGVAPPTAIAATRRRDDSAQSLGRRRFDPGHRTADHTGRGSRPGRRAIEATL